MDGFRFKLGDLVVTKAGIADAMINCAMGTHSHPLHYTVIEQMAQECPGGVQRHYGLSSHDPAHRRNEIELADPSEFDVEAAKKLLFDSKKQQWAIFGGAEKK